MHRDICNILGCEKTGKESINAALEDANRTAMVYNELLIRKEVWGK